MKELHVRNKLRHYLPSSTIIRPNYQFPLATNLKSYMKNSKKSQGNLSIIAIQNQKVNVVNVVLTTTISLNQLKNSNNHQLWIMIPINQHYLQLILQHYLKFILILIILLTHPTDHNQNQHHPNDQNQNH